MKLQAFAASLVGVLAKPDVAFTSIGSFSLKNAAFPAVTSYPDSETFLLVSSFGMLSPGAIYVVPNLKEAIVTNTVN